MKQVRLSWALASKREEEKEDGRRYEEEEEEYKTLGFEKEATVLTVGHCIGRPMIPSQRNT